MKDFQTNIILSIIEKISEKCEDKAIDMLKNLNNDKYKTIYKILYAQKDTLHIPDTFFEKMVIYLGTTYNENWLTGGCL